MIRILLVAGLLAATAVPSSAQLLGDFECVSDLGGPETYHGTLRIEEPTRFGFLTEGATIDAQYAVDLSNPDAVMFDDAFANRISTGATMVNAQMLEDEFAYRALIRTRKGDDVSVYCLYVY